MTRHGKQRTPATEASEPEDEGSPPSGAESVRGIEADAQPRQRVVVAVDASPPSLAALQVAARLAELLEMTLEAVFVEDIDLLHLAMLPFTRELGSYTARFHELNSGIVERSFRRKAAESRHAVEEAASPHSVAWEFRVVRGSVRETVGSMVEGAGLVGVGRAGKSRQRLIGSVTKRLIEESERPIVVGARGATVESPIVVVETGSPASQRALQLAALLARRARPSLQMLVLVLGPPIAGTELRLTEALGEMRTQATAMQVTDRAEAPKLLRQIPVGLLVVPREEAKLITATDAAALIVP